MSVTMNRSKPNPKVEFKYGGPLFSKIGSSNISAVNWDISFNFGVQIDFDIPKGVPSLKPKQEVDLGLCDRHL